MPSTFPLLYQSSNSTFQFPLPIKFIISVSLRTLYKIDPEPSNLNHQQPSPVLIAHDVQKGLLLSCEGSIWQIFCSGGGSYCEGEFLITTRDTLPLSLDQKSNRKSEADVFLACFMWFSGIKKNNCRSLKSQTYQNKNGDKFIISVRMVNHTTLIHFFLVGSVCPSIITVSNWFTIWNSSSAFSSSSKSSWKGVSMILSRISLPTWAILVKLKTTQNGHDTVVQKMATLTFLSYISILYSRKRTNFCWPVAIICIHLVGVPVPHLGYHHQETFSFWWSPESTFTCRDLKW